MANDTKAIRDMIQARSDAVHARDVARALEHLATDAVCYDLRPPLQFRGAAARDTRAMEEWFRTWDGAIDVELSDPTIAVEGDLAYAYGLGHMRGKKRDAANDDGDVDLWYRVTLCFQRQRGSGRSFTSTSRCRSTWTAATRPRSI